MHYTYVLFSEADRKLYIAASDTSSREEAAVT